jgi:hypothetical protein
MEIKEGREQSVRTKEPTKKSGVLISTGHTQVPVCCVVHLPTPLSLSLKLWPADAVDTHNFHRDACQRRGPQKSQAKDKFLRVNSSHSQS